MPKPTTFKSPFGSSFTSAVRRGTPCTQAVWNISQRQNTTPGKVWQSLWKAGLVQRQKMNGQWIYWPVNGQKGPAGQWKSAQWQMWQWFVDWCITSGQCTPKQLLSHHGSQQAFMTWCRKFFGKQWPSQSSTTTRRTSTGRTLRLTGTRSSTTGRRMRRAA